MISPNIITSCNLVGVKCILYISISEQIPITKVITYTEVAQGGISSRGIHIWLWIFCLFFPTKNLKNKKIKNKYQSTFQCGRHNVFFLKITFLLKKTWKNRPKISPNFIFCSIKTISCATSIYLMTLDITFPISLLTRWTWKCIC